MPDVIVIAHNIRSTHNVGAIFRTAEGFGAKKIILSGYTPYPKLGSAPNNTQKETRLPHIAEKVHSQIHKTALDAENLVPFVQQVKPDFDTLRKEGYQIVALEQAPTSIMLNKYKVPEKVALLLGEEVEGITPELLAECDDIIEIPMHGQKESFNVSVAAGIALYALASPGGSL